MKISKPLLYVSLYSISWAISIIIARFVLKTGFSPLFLTLEQNFFASIFLLPIFLIQQKTLSHTSKKSLFGAVLAGILGSGLAVLLSQYGLRLSTSINYSFLIMTSTVFAVIIARFLLKEFITPLKFIFLTMMMIGAFLLSTKGQSLILHSGDIYILIAASIFGLTANISRMIIKKDIQPNIVSFIRVLTAWIFIGSFLFLTGNSLAALRLTLPIVLVGLTQGFLLIFLNQSFLVASTSYTTMLSMMTPVFVALMAYPLLGEKLILIQWLGAIMIILGGVLTQIKQAA